MHLSTRLILGSGVILVVLIALYSWNIPSGQFACLNSTAFSDWLLYPYLNPEVMQGVCITKVTKRVNPDVPTAEVRSEIYNWSKGGMQFQLQRLTISNGPSVAWKEGFEVESPQNLSRDTIFLNRLPFFTCSYFVYSAFSNGNYLLDIRPLVNKSAIEQQVSSFNLSDPCAQRSICGAHLQFSASETPLRRERVTLPASLSFEIGSTTNQNQLPIESTLKQFLSYAQTLDPGCKGA